MFQGFTDTLLSELSRISIDWMHFRAWDVEMDEKLKVKLKYLCHKHDDLSSQPHGWNRSPWVLCVLPDMSYSCMLDGVLRRRSTQEEQHSNKRPRLETRSAGRATLQ